MDMESLRDSDSPVQEYLDGAVLDWTRSCKRWRYRPFDTVSVCTPLRRWDSAGGDRVGRDPTDLGSARNQSGGFCITPQKGALRLGRGAAVVSGRVGTIRMTHGGSRARDHCGRSKPGQSATGAIGAAP